MTTDPLDREINRLKSRVLELEKQLTGPSRPSGNPVQVPFLPENLDPLREHGGNRGSWEYTLERSSGSDQPQSYGPASSFYFLSQMNSYMDKALASAEQDSISSSEQHHHSLFRWVDAPSQSASTTKNSLRRRNSFGQKPLSRWQEEYFLDLYWQSYHCMYPVIDEAEFRAHHNEIWITPYEARQPSPLVDIILAITMQYSTLQLPPDMTNAVINAEEKGKDAATAGKSYFRRCQALLAEELESPSVTTLQCHIFSVIYLFNTGSHNTAYGMLALACRIAVILGLHQEPLHDLDEEQRILHKRLWWTVFALEIKAAMELGRPLAVNMSQVTCGLPANGRQMGSISSLESSIPAGLSSCFTANLQFIKLVLAARSVYVTFYTKAEDVLGPSHQHHPYGNPGALETCAEYLASKMEYLQTWRREIPESLKMKRKDGMEPLSAEGTLILEIHPTVSFLQQRQRLFLELHYHTLSMNLFRPFICFTKYRELQTPQTEANAASCVSHAMAITNIIHQMLTETDFLAGWLETFKWHANAFVSLIGYAVALPDGERTPEARVAIRKSISTFDILSSSLTMASTSAKIARDLAAKANVLIERVAAGSAQLNSNTFLSQVNSSDDNDDIFSLDPSTSELLTSTAVDDNSFGLGNHAMDWINEEADNPIPGIWNLENDSQIDPFLSWPGHESRFG
jgi:hypothetical protein